MPKGVYPLKSAITRLLSLIEKTASCWVWRGYSKNRYGSIMVNGRYVKAHRFSYEHYIGPIPAGLYVLHKCDNSLCVNPEHLFVGTQFDNMTDMKQKGRELKAKGSNAGRSRLTEEQVLSIRQELQETNITCWQLAKKYNVTANAIRCIKLRLTWRHI